MNTPHILSPGPQLPIATMIVPLTVYAPGSQSFEVCTDILRGDLTASLKFRQYLSANKDFKAEGWREFRASPLALCRDARQHWRVNRA